MSLSTHVLDARTGRPAAGVAVRLDERVEGQWRTAAEGRTDADGRIATLGDPGAGTHRLHFDTGAYFAAAGVEAFYPEVTVTFTVARTPNPSAVPFGESLYRDVNCDMSSLTQIPVTVSGNQGAISANGGGYSLTLAARAGEQLVPGTYTSAPHYLGPVGQPGSDIVGFGRGCNGEFGTFTI